MIESKGKTLESYLEKQRNLLLNDAELNWEVGEVRRISIPCHIYLSARDSTHLRNTYDLIFGAEEAHAIEIDVPDVDVMLYPDFTGTSAVEDREMIDEKL